MRRTGEAVWFSFNRGDPESSRVTMSACRGRIRSHMSLEIISEEAGEGRSEIPTKFPLKNSGITEGDTGLSGRL